MSSSLANPSGRPGSSLLPKPAYSGALKAISAFLVLVYLVNCCTPLRLHVDMLRYFAIKDCIELGCPPDSDAAKDYLPFGYTVLLLVLSKLGVLKSWSIVLINCIYLFGGLYLIFRIFRSSIDPLLCLVLVMLNWTTLKFTIHPLSEMQYLFFSSASIYLFYQYTREKKIWLLLAAFGLGSIAFLTRSVGIALAAALVTGLLWQYRTELIGLIRKHKLVVAGVLIVLIGVVIFSRQLGLNHYTGVFNKQFKEGVTLPRILGWHFTEWAEICFNVSIVKVSPYLHGGIADKLFLVAGICFFAGFVYLVFLRKNQIPFIVKSYLFFYSVVMFDWPFYDPRFWVPVVPFIVVSIAASGIFTVRRWRAPFVLYFCVYSLLGALSVGYLSYTSLNREVMARTHANGVYRNEYETVFYGKPLSDTATHIDQAALEVIRRYDR
jgi:hypothetical protein